MYYKVKGKILVRKSHFDQWMRQFEVDTKKDLDDYYLAARVRVPYKLLDTSAINLVNYIATLSSRALLRERVALVSRTPRSNCNCNSSRFHASLFPLLSSLLV